MKKDVVISCGGIKMKDVEPRGIPKKIEEKVNRKNITELVFILDRSGSMAGMEEDTIGGFNAMIEKQKKQSGEAFVTTITFSNQSTTLHDRVPLNQIEPLTSKDYLVGGCTALLDAIGGAIDYLDIIHKHIRKEDLPKNTLFVITTDGMENASRKFTSKQVKEMIESHKEMGWEFLFLGANIDAIETADTIGISADRAVNYEVKRGKQTFEEIGKTIKSVRSCSEIPVGWAEFIETKKKGK